MFCPNCGAQLPDGMKFCTSCGAAQTGEPAPAPEAPAFVPAPAPEAPAFEPAPEVPSTVYIPAGEDVGKTVAIPSAPVQAEYTAPVAGAYQAPAADAYQAPAADAYQAPAAGAYQAPAAGAYQAPAAGAYQAPAPGAYQAPAPGAYQAPAPGAYQAPAPGAYQAPGYPQPYPAAPAPKKKKTGLIIGIIIAVVVLAAVAAVAMFLLPSAKADKPENHGVATESELIDSYFAAAAIGDKDAITKLAPYEALVIAADKGYNQDAYLQAVDFGYDFYGITPFAREAAPDKDVDLTLKAATLSSDLGLTVTSYNTRAYSATYGDEDYYIFFNIAGIDGKQYLISVTTAEKGFSYRGGFASMEDAIAAYVDAIQLPVDEAILAVAGLTYPSIVDKAFEDGEISDYTDIAYQMDYYTETYGAPVERYELKGVDEYSEEDMNTIAEDAGFTFNEYVDYTVYTYYDEGAQSEYNVDSYYWLDIDLIEVEGKWYITSIW